jgi:hypothetical protein
MKVPENIQKIVDANKKNLLKKKNVIGMGFGFRYTAGKKLDEKTLVVLVSQKEPIIDLPKKDLIPSTFDGVKVDVRQVGKIIAYKSRTDRWRPAPGGVSIGHHLVTAGTLGAFVKDIDTGTKLILSNNHVLANSNNAAKRDAIIQPGAADGGRSPQDLVAQLERFVRIEMKEGDDDNGGGGSCTLFNLSAGLVNILAKLLGSQHRLQTKKISQVANLVDAAVAKPIEDSAFDNEIIDIGVIEGVKKAELGMAVRKSGRTTATTTGTIDLLDAAVDVSYGTGKTAHFEHQILTSDMSRPGDSGSLLVDGSEKKAVGLLFAGSDEVTVHSPIETVLDLLNITF